MTEKDSRDLDAFARQSLIGGKKVPVLWGLLGKVGKSRQVDSHASEQSSPTLQLPFPLT